MLQLKLLLRLTYIESSWYISDMIAIIELHLLPNIIIPLESHDVLNIMIWIQTK